MTLFFPDVNVWIALSVADHVWTVEELCALMPEPIVAKSTKDKELLRKALGESPEGQ
jgi:hypothetical protein